MSPSLSALNAEQNLLNADDTSRAAIIDPVPDCDFMSGHPSTASVDQFLRLSGKKR